MSWPTPIEPDEPGSRECDGHRNSLPAHDASVKDSRIELWPHQRANAAHLVQVLRTRGAAIDASDVGTGKTLTALEVVRQLGDPPTVVVCPRAVVPAWERASAQQGVPVTVINYERLRTGRTPLGGWEARRRWRWAPEVRFVVWDEVHRAKDWRSLTAAMVRACRRQQIPCLGLSATLAESPLEMEALGYVLRLHDGYDARPSLANPDPVSWWSWLRRYGCRPGRFSRFEFSGPSEVRLRYLARLREALFPDCGVRTTHEALGELFPEQRVLVDRLCLGDPEQLQQQYAALAECIAQMRASWRTDTLQHPLVAILRLRQTIELLKVPALAELVEDSLDGRHQVVVYVCYRATVRALCARLGVVNSYIDGSQRGPAGERQRQQAIDDFQAGRTRVLVCNIDAGGVGISLHDTTGDAPRLSLICPGWSARALRQAMGRIYRAGGRSPCVQRLLFAADTVEERVFFAVRRKLQQLDALQDTDLQPIPLPAQWDEESLTEDVYEHAEFDG